MDFLKKEVTWAVNQISDFKKLQLISFVRGTGIGHYFGILFHIFDVHKTLKVLT